MQNDQWTVYNDSLGIVKDTTTKETVLSNTGMQGEPIPYKFYSDGNVISALAVGFLLIVVAMQNDNKNIWMILKSCITTPGRNSLFDSNKNQTYVLPTLLLTTTTAIMCGLLTYHYFSYSYTAFFDTANHLAIMATYISIFMVFVMAKWIIYTIIDSVFFDKGKRTLWHKAFFNVISSSGIVLFAASLYIVFLDSEFHLSSIIVLIIIVLSKILLFYNCIKYFFSGFYGSLHLILYFCTLEIIPDLVLWKSMGLVNSLFI